MRTRSTYDPFGWRLQELADPDINPARRAELLDDLLVAEAEELAAGRRHLTIVHGEPTDLADVEDLNEFYDTVSAIVENAEWFRLAGGKDYVTVTVAGARGDECLALAADAAHHRSTARWLIAEAPHPPC
ncbi:MAG TPA: hypothetical protein PLV68_19445 [Ilumatobacteraceae bacterium]|nr:hypothetical protein [Ilumatobacteraceae bacterium]